MTKSEVQELKRQIRALEAKVERYEKNGDGEKRRRRMFGIGNKSNTQDIGCTITTALRTFGSVRYITQTNNRADGEMIVSALMKFCDLFEEGKIAIPATWNIVQAPKMEG